MPLATQHSTFNLIHLLKFCATFLPTSADLQTVLVRSCWSELFTLGLAQCSATMCLPTMLAAILNHLQASLQRGGESPTDPCTECKISRY